MSNVPRLLKVLRRTGRPPAATGVVHDFTAPYWGRRNLGITAIQDEGLRIRVACRGDRRPGAGDQVLLRVGDGQSVRYRVLDIEPSAGVTEMYYLNLLLDPRTRKSTGGTDAG